MELYYLVDIAPRIISATLVYVLIADVKAWNIRLSVEHPKIVKSVIDVLLITLIDLIRSYVMFVLKSRKKVQTVQLTVIVRFNSCVHLPRVLITKIKHAKEHILLIKEMSHLMEECV